MHEERNDDFYPGSYFVGIKKITATCPGGIPPTHTRSGYLRLFSSKPGSARGWIITCDSYENYPDVNSLAAAREEDVLKMWQGLGYYSRARNLHKAALSVMKDHGGNFPSTYNEIRKLSGIGDYTAAAIASVAFGLPYPVVDGNVLRFFSRFFGIREPVNSAGGKAVIGKLALDYIDKKNPGDFNQAIMEFGAIQCKPANPGLPSLRFSERLFCLHPWRG